MYIYTYTHRLYMSVTIFLYLLIYIHIVLHSWYAVDSCGKGVSPLSPQVGHGSLRFLEVRQGGDRDSPRSWHCWIFGVEKTKMAPLFFPTPKKHVDRCSSNKSIFWWTICNKIDPSWSIYMQHDTLLELLTNKKWKIITGPRFLVTGWTLM